MNPEAPVIVALAIVAVVAVVLGLLPAACFAAGIFIGRRRWL
jgi:hypothetical protein